MILIENVEHALATAAHDTVKVARFVEHQVLPALQKAQANESTVEAITGLVSPQAANIERVSFAVLGKVIAAIQAAENAASAGGVNISIDAELVSAVKAILPAVQS